MIRYALGTDLWKYPLLAKTMFADRTRQFSERLRWNVEVDQDGFERDQYDAHNPIYVMLEAENGAHLGSMRILPTTGRTMINEHFQMVLDAGIIQQPDIWECTRFCLAPGSSPRSALKLFASAGRLMQEFKVSSFVAVFDSKMVRRYRFYGVSPEILGQTKTKESHVFAGKWNFDSELLSLLTETARLDPLECELALANSSFLSVRYKAQA